MESAELLYDNIDAIVVGEGSEEFILRMFKGSPHVFQISEFGGFTQVTRVVSSAHLWIHFNFWFCKDSDLELAIEMVKEQWYMGIVTYLADDILSFKRAKDLYEKYFQDSLLPSRHRAPKRQKVTNYSTVNEELGLINLWWKPDRTEALGAGLLAAISTERFAQALVSRSDDFGRNLKFICPSNSGYFFEEKQNIYLWMLENYKRKNPNLEVHEDLAKELKSQLKKDTEDNCLIL